MDAACVQQNVCKKKKKNPVMPVILKGRKKLDLSIW